MTAAPAVHVGQLWQDNDPRSPGRYLLVVATDTTHATVRQVAHNPTDRITAELPGVRPTRIRLDRFRPTSTGYTLIAGPGAEERCTHPDCAEANCATGQCCTGNGCDCPATNDCSTEVADYHDDGTVTRWCSDHEREYLAAR